MGRWMLTLGYLTLIAGAVAAQGPGYPYGSNYAPGQYGPNAYNRQQQPLSPYLNLLRGGNPAANYFYGVRPGMMPGGQQVGGGFGSPATGIIAPRPGFFAGAASNPTQEPIQLPEAGSPIDSLPPSGHPVIFGSGSIFNRQGGNQRPGQFGNSAPPAFNRAAPTGTTPRR